MANENDEAVDSTNNETDQAENLETTAEETAEETLPETEDVEALKEKNRQLFARAKKAEGFVLKDGKWIKKEKPPVEKKPEAKDATSEYLTKEEAVLIAKGIDLEDLEQLKLIQKATGKSLKEASESPLYQGYTKQKEAETKRQKAQLGASRGGGGRSGDEEKLNKPNLSTDEHRAIWEKEMSK